MCSYLDVMATDSYIMINKKLAKMTNFQTAAYWAILLNVLKQVKLKNTYDPATGFFPLKRSYIEDELGINTDEQKNCDIILARLGTLNVDPGNKNRVSLNVKRMQELLVDDSLIPEDLLPKTIKQTYTDKQTAKKAGIKAGIVALFNETNEDALTAITNLVEVYYDKGYCKHASWTPVVTIINAACPTPEAKVELINFILTTNWQSITAAIDKFMQSHKSNGTKINAEQKKCSGTSEISF